MARGDQLREPAAHAPIARRRRAQRGSWCRTRRSRDRRAHARSDGLELDGERGAHAPGPARRLRRAAARLAQLGGRTLCATASSTPFTNAGEGSSRNGAPARPPRRGSRTPACRRARARRRSAARCDRRRHAREPPVPRVLRDARIERVAVGDHARDELLRKGARASGRSKFAATPSNVSSHVGAVRSAAAHDVDGVEHLERHLPRLVAMGVRALHRGRRVRGARPARGGADAAAQARRETRHLDRRERGLGPCSLGPPRARAPDRDRRP